MASGDMESTFSFSSFGVGVRLDFDDADLLARFKDSLSKVFRNTLVEKERGEDDHLISVWHGDSPEVFNYSFQGENLDFIGSESELFHLLRTLVRVTVAANTREKLFIHAGAVGWNGRGLILPAQSFAGKTSLVLELCRLGATYYSDEYAVIDDQGHLHPFPKDLSIRGPGGRHDRRDAEISEFGGILAEQPLPTSLILFSSFEEGRRSWSPSQITAGEALLRLVPHMIAFPKDPEFCLRIGGILVEKSARFEALRGDVKEFAPRILELLDK